MSDNLRYMAAGVLIFLIILLQPVYLKWLGYDSGVTISDVSSDASSAILIEDLQNKNTQNNTDDDKPDDWVDTAVDESFITIETPLYVATISNRGGGTFVNYELNPGNLGGNKYIGGFSDDGLFEKNIPVSLILGDSDNHCQPCLAEYNKTEKKYEFINQPFLLRSPAGAPSIIMLAKEDSLELEYVLDGITKKISFSGDSFITFHNYYGYDNSNEKLELVWAGGLRPTEKNEKEDIQYSSAVMSQAGKLNQITTNSPDKPVYREKCEEGETEWVAVRSKYFIAAILANNNLGSCGALTANNVLFGERQHTPVYNASMGLPVGSVSFSSRIYLGPLDVDHISQANSNLDDTMNWGWAPVRPISRGILWVLKFMHSTLHLNYGLVLLLFALIVRLVTGPLTKKSFESTQKMQKIQPQIKAVQEKYKKDPQRLNKEMMGMYKKHGVNPLGGCLPMLMQMPLLMALFIVFRSTIEFRGQPFIFWVNDLSQPDVVFTLPFNIPIYGSGVAILPLIMGATLFLTMRMSSATMDKSQKPVMYIMNGFFILLFNTFPSGLNLYYTAYNALSFLQQKGIRRKLADA